MGWYVRSQVKPIIGKLTFLAAFFLVITCFIAAWIGNSVSLNLVASGSMSPALVEGDIVAWAPINIEDVEIGDVIVYKSYVAWPDEKIIIHRVSNILTDSEGNPILETKGDNNDWMDQEGPNIPEPYIGEDHLMGKALSIGQEPLKIPYVGIFVLILPIFFVLYQVIVKKPKEKAHMNIFG